MGTKNKIILTLSSIVLIAAIIVIAVFAFVSQTFSITNRLTFTAQEGVMGDVVISAKCGDEDVLLQDNTFTLEGDLSEYTIPEIDFGEGETVLEYSVAITNRSASNIMVSLDKTCDTTVANTSDTFGIGSKIIKNQNNRIVYPQETITVITEVSLVNTNRSATVDLGLAFNCALTNNNRYVYFVVNGSTESISPLLEQGTTTLTNYSSGGVTYNAYDTDSERLGACYYAGETIDLTAIKTDTLYASTTDSTNEKFVFTLNGSGNDYTVTNNGSATTGRLVIPSTYNGKPVTNIALNAFAYNENITSVYIPDTITEIPQAAFGGCENLRSVRFPQTLTTIGMSAFINSGIETVTLPDTVTTLLVGAFEGCYALRYVRLSPNITDMTGAFARSGLQTIVIPEGITTISSSMFYNSGYENMEQSEIDGGVFGNLDFFRAEMGSKALTHIVLPSTLTTIEGNAFFGCSDLAEITIPSLVTSLGDNAMKGCSSLTSITIQATTPPTIGGDCFTEIDADCILYVPASSVTAYTTAWGEYFASVQAIPT